MKRIKRAVATVGKYTAKDGKEKNRYQNVGTLFKRDDDTVCLKLESIPIGPEFTGWINFYDIDSKPKQEKPKPQQTIPEFEDDDIPF